MDNSSNNVQMNIVLRSIVSEVNSYTVLNTQPLDWDTNWMSYFSVTYNPISTKPVYFDPTKHFKFVDNRYIKGSPSDSWESVIWYDARYQAINSSIRPTFVPNEYYEGHLQYIEDGENIGDSFAKVNELVEHVDSLEKTTVRGSSLSPVAFSGSYTDLSNKPFVASTTSYWESHQSFVSEANVVYVYTDFDKDASNNDIPGLKYGDGVTPVADLPFIAGTVTQAMINSWNDKVGVKLNELDATTLEFYK